MLNQKKTEPQSSIFFSLTESAHPVCGLPQKVFTTPPITRKRKAAEAAISDHHEHPPATKGSDPSLRNATGLSSSNTRFSEGTTSTTPRRESDSTAATSGDLEVPVSVREKKKAADLATPATTTGSMDSDDDFMSDVSSQEDFLDTQGSDDESLGEGGFVLSLFVCCGLTEVVGSGFWRRY